MTDGYAEFEVRSGTHRFRVVGRADLRLHKSVVGRAKVRVGAPARFRLRVANRGRDAAVGPITLVDRLPRGLKAVSARGKGWQCRVRRGPGTITCVRTSDLAPRQSAPAVRVVARATRKAVGRPTVNRARVTAVGDVGNADNRDTARVRVVLRKKRR
ncbi:hypothetical protein MF408_15780 [Nocardioides sp. TF02-7]|nr:hypothetical protein MF408_15780 [Nocardioides sp. TF02-7]